MKINLRKDAFFVEDEHWHRLKNKYEKFIQKNKNKKIVLLELGVGFNTPSIIRFPFESITSKYEHVTLIRVNNKYPEIAFEIQNKSILVKEDCGKFIRQL